MPVFLALLTLTACEPEVRRGPRPPVPVKGTGGLPRGTDGPGPAPTARPGTCDPCSLLMEHDVHALRDGKACELCGATDPAVCDGWPEPDVVSCERYDWLRNCIYARLGYDFETAPEWRRVFDEEPWYRPDPKFTWKRVTSIQKRNAEELQDLAKGRSCRK